MKMIFSLLAVLVIGASSAHAESPVAQKISKADAIATVSKALTSTPANLTSTLFIETLKLAQKSGVTEFATANGEFQKNGNSSYYTLDFVLIAGTDFNHLENLPEPIIVQAEIMITADGHLYVFNYSIERQLLMQKMQPGVSMGNH